MRWNDIKKIIKREVLKEATTVNAGNTKFNLRTGVNKNPTKLGLKIQFEPLAGGLEADTKAKLEVALQEKLNMSLQQYDIQVSKDTDVPRPEVIGFFIPLAQLKNLIVKSLTGQKVDAPDVKNKLEVALQEKLNVSLQEYDIQVSKDTDVPRPEVIGFFIPLSQIKNLIVKSLTGSAPSPDVQAPEPEGETSPEGGEDEEINEMINEALISEMRLRDLNEISKVVIKEDFYTFINAGNNILRTMEEKGMGNGKKYLGYLVKHNIM